MLEQRIVEWVIATAERKRSQLRPRLSWLRLTYWGPKGFLIILGAVGAYSSTLKTNDNAPVWIGILTSVVAGFSALEIPRDLPVIEHAERTLERFILDARLRWAEELAIGSGQIRPGSTVVTEILRRFSDILGDVNGYL